MIPNYNPYNPYGYEPEIPESTDEDMSDEERLNLLIKRAVVRFLTLIVGMALMLAMCAMFGSCTTTKYVPVPEYHTDTLRQVTVRHDSVMVRDSIHVSEKGDTVRIERWHTQWRDRWHTDTIYQSKRDSISYPVEVTKEVPAELTWWQQTRIHIGGIVFWLLLFVACWYIGGLIRKVKKKYLP
jgi:hypothetical protein